MTLNADTGCGGGTVPFHRPARKGEKGNELREEDLDLPLARLG
jgi:hypothetical protein